MLIMKKIFSFILLLFISVPVAGAYKKYKILTTIAPIASLVKMVTGELVDVEVIQKSGSCPHHFHLKPSEVFSIKNANFLVLVDEKFESHIAKYAKNSTAKLITISKFQNLRIENNNFHIWLDINNAKVILDNIKNIMIEAGLSKKTLENNYIIAIRNLENLHIPKIGKESMILGESLHYLTSKKEDKFFNISHNLSFKKLEILKLYLKENNIKCLVIDPDIKEKLVRKFYSGELIEIDAENWLVSHIKLEDFYNNYMHEILKKIAPCLLNS